MTVFTPANILTISRMVLVPVFLEHGVYACRFDPGDLLLDDLD